MICYRDRTYCVSRNCVNKSCDRRMTDEIQEKANKSCLPVSVEDATETCRYYVKSRKG